MWLNVLKPIDQSRYFLRCRLFNGLATPFVGKLDQFLFEIERVSGDHLQVNFDGLGVSLQHGIDVIQRQQGIKNPLRFIGVLILLNHKEDATTITTIGL